MNKIKNAHKTLSVVDLSSVHIWYFFALSVSYYAFIPDWLLPSLSSEGLCKKIPYTTGSTLGNLKKFAGLFSFRLWTFAPKA